MTSEAGSRSLAGRTASSGKSRERTQKTTDKVARPHSPKSNGAQSHGAQSHGAQSHSAQSHGTKGTGARQGAANGTVIGARQGAANGTAIGARQGAANGRANTAGHHLEPVRVAAPATPTSLVHDDPLDILLNEAQAAVSDGANTLRDVRERYRTAYLEQVVRWERLRTQTGNAANDGNSQMAGHEAMAGREVNQERSTLGRIELAVKSLENAWLFLAREDTSLVSDPTNPHSAADAQMRVVEAQEAERSRLAREVHDGPAQALSNAIFQVEVVQRLLDRDEAAARVELQQLRDVLTRELKGVRAYLSQLRPPLLADLGLSGAIQDAANQTANALGIQVDVELDQGVDDLPETVEIVVLRVIQEALQNARKHAQPSSLRIRMSQEQDGRGRDNGAWTLEVRDDGRGFDSDDPPVSGRRHFGLQFMRERAELIGARFEVRSSPNLGTAVWMTIPPGAMGMPIPGEES